MSSNRTHPSLLEAGLALVSVAAFLWVAGILLDGWAARLLHHEEQTKLVETPYRELENCRAEQQERLSEYRWIDREGGVVQLPIDRAMELVSEESQ